MLANLRSNILVSSLYALLAFPLFYFVYKFGSPYLGMIDFFEYYKLYSHMDFKSADSPLNMRLVGSFLVYCMSKLGIFYNTACAIDNAPFDKLIYFNAIFFNYLCVVFTSVFIYGLTKKLGHNLLMCFMAGLIYLLGFGTIFFEIMPLQDSFSVLLFVIILQYYFKKSAWVFLFIILLILQREYIILALGLLSFIDMVKFKNRYYAGVFAHSVICFIVYFLLRKNVFETARYAYQTDLSFIVKSLFQMDFPLGPFIRQTLMTMNVFLLYLALVAYKYYRKMDIDKYALFKVTCLLAQLLILTFLLGLGNNAGRYFYMLLPLIIIYLINEIAIFDFGRTIDTEPSLTK